MTWFEFIISMSPIVGLLGLFWGMCGVLLGILLYLDNRSYKSCVDLKNAIDAAQSQDLSAINLREKILIRVNNASLSELKLLLMLLR